MKLAKKNNEYYRLKNKSFLTCDIFLNGEDINVSMRGLGRGIRGGFSSMKLSFVGRMRLVMCYTVNTHVALLC